jgi:Na+/phosphate symporter
MGTTLPRLTADTLRTGILEMCAKAAEMIRLTRDAFLEHHPAGLDSVSSLGRELHLREKRLTDHVAMQLREMPWSLGRAQHLVFAPAALERIGDSVEALARCIRSIHQDGIPFSERACTEVLTLFSRASGLLQATAAAIRTGDRTSSPVSGPRALPFRPCVRRWQHSTKIAYSRGSAPLAPPRSSSPCWTTSGRSSGTFDGWVRQRR